MWVRAYYTDNIILKSQVVEGSVWILKVLINGEKRQKRVTTNMSFKILKMVLWLKVHKLEGFKKLNLLGDVCSLSQPAFFY